MTINQRLPEWRIIGETVPGASHLRAGIPNQDSILHVRESARSLPLVLSVSDGHGSNKCFRSDRGSRFAVKKAAQLVGEFLDERRGRFDHAELESKGKELLPREFVKRWRDAVEADLKARPFSPEEFATLEKKDGPRGRTLVEGQSAARLRRDLSDRRGRGLFHPLSPTRRRRHPHRFRERRNQPATAGRRSPLRQRDNLALLRRRGAGFSVSRATDFRRASGADPAFD